MYLFIYLFVHLIKKKNNYSMGKKRSIKKKAFKDPVAHLYIYVNPFGHINTSE